MHLIADLLIFREGFLTHELHNLLKIVLHREAERERERGREKGRENMVEQRRVQYNWCQLGDEAFQWKGQ